MSTFSIHTLGCGSAKPTMRHQPSSTVIDHRGNLFMIDCGEGAQLAFQRQRLKFSRLGHIFLTHLHGDHVLGLPGLISTLALGNQGGELVIHTFEDGKEILTEIFDFFARDLSYKLSFNVIKPEDKLIWETSSLTIRTVKLRHRVPTVGYIFEEKPKLRHINREMVDFHHVPVSQMRDIKGGADFIKSDGTIIRNEILTTPPTPSLKYSHISDTIYMPELAEKIGPSDLLFHETTYLDCNRAEAKERYHSTAEQAAMVARDSGAKALITGHYSSRYNDDNLFAEEARSVFPNVILNREGLVTNLD
ncbi:MAG: ribonuclease Z [Candidatus Amulumruptor caecigallinarius]|nr:ribonuclease Z [Candidatus Amulumruptor caecigallinarius]